MEDPLYFVYQLVVPAETTMAVDYKKHQDAAELEHQVLKQKVLQYESLLESSEIYSEDEPVQVSNAPITEAAAAWVQKRTAQIKERQQHGGRGRVRKR